MGRALFVLLAMSALALAWPAADARAQCVAGHGDSAFSGDPSPPCRARPPAAPPIRIGVELQLGWAEHAAPLSEATSGIGLYADLALASWFGVGVRGAHRGMAGDGTSASGLGAFVVTAGPRFTLFTEPARHEAFRLGLDAGALLIVDGVGASGPMVEVSLERQAGNLFRGRGSPRPAHGTAIELGIALRYQQGLGAASDYRAFLVSTYMGFEVLSRLPEGAPPRRTRPKVEYILSASGAAGSSLGDLAGAGGLAQLGLGFPVGEWLVLELAADAMILAQPEADPSVVYSLLGGLRSPRWFPIFAEVLAGYSAVLGPQPRGLDSGPILDIVVGGQFPNAFGCGFGLTMGPVTRIGLGGGTSGWAFVGGQIGMRYDNLIRAAECGY
ncbi:MAG: hypothetical protein DRJ42_01090 [Deltaproteobacteria bacterium]|nr:MAG: hypothetical protein DRJ42_01090 [Deltaproteobacteria bacterium]